MPRMPIPMEWYIATLAAFTIPLFVCANIPVWATYVTWAGAFLIGPNEAIRKLFPTLIVGTVSGVVFFALAMTIDPILGWVALPNSIIAFVMTVGLLYFARIPAFALVPGIFFGFACYVGVALERHPATISALFVPWLYATGALLLGPPLAWISVAPYLPAKVEDELDAAEVQTAKARVAASAENL